LIVHEFFCAQKRGTRRRAKLEQIRNRLDRDALLQKILQHTDGCISRLLEFVEQTKRPGTGKAGRF
jgi:hypothetical protein